jgi:hypothetical protein
MPDWLVAVDDLLTHRLQACTRCGVRERWYWGIATAGAVVVAYVLCQGCYRQSTGLRAVEAVLEARYAASG